MAGISSPMGLVGVQYSGQNGRQGGLAWGGHPYRCSDISLLGTFLFKFFSILRL